MRQKEKLLVKKILTKLTLLDYISHPFDVLLSVSEKHDDIEKKNGTTENSASRSP